MDITRKTGDSGFNGEVEREETAITSQVLRNQQLTLQDELRRFMNDGDAAGVIRTQNLLRELPIRINAAEIAELRASIDATNERLKEVAEEIEYAEKLKGKNNRILAEKIKAAEEAGLAVERVNFVLYQLDAETETLREARRDYRVRLNNLIEDTMTQSDKTQ